MAKFAIYFIPDKTDPFYEIGSQTIGYCIRNQERSNQNPPNLSPFKNSWQDYAWKYGFHMTLSDALFYDPKTLPIIKSTFVNILKSFDSNKAFELLAVQRPFLQLNGPKKEIVGLFYEPSSNLIALHSAIVTELHPLGIGSLYTERLSQNPNYLSESPHKQNNIKKYHSPTVLGDFSPHFTLLNPLISPEKDKILSLLEHFKLKSLALVLQKDPNSGFIIEEEFEL